MSDDDGNSSLKERSNKTDVGNRLAGALYHYLYTSDEMTTVDAIIAKAQKDIDKVMAKALKEVAALEGKSPKATSKATKSKTTSKTTSKASKESKTDKPKRPLNAFMIFSNANRDSVKKSLGGSPSIGDVAKELGRQWNDIKDTKKAKKYHDEAAKQKAAAE